MKQTRKHIYAHIINNGHEAVFYGIKFADFVECMPVPIENLLLLKSDYCGERDFRGFWLVEGKEGIAALMCEDIYGYGDFCFVDYLNASSLGELTELQIAELLYLGHTHKPLGTPFFEVLQNRFAYFSHDDGWYSRIYCKNENSLVSLLLNVVQKRVGRVLKKDLVSGIGSLVGQGLLIEFEENKMELYEVGKYVNMNEWLNNLENIKRNAGRFLSM